MESYEFWHLLCNAKRSDDIKFYLRSRGVVTRYTIINVFEYEAGTVIVCDYLSTNNSKIKLKSFYISELVDKFNTKMLTFERPE